MQVPPSTPLYPALHVQVVASTLPGGLLACAGQRVHASKPGCGLCVSAAHATHASKGPVWPGGQPQEALPATLELTPGHTAHSPDPASGLCVFAAHGTHTPPSAPVKPGRQRQLAARWLTGGDVESAGQSTHTPAFMKYAPSRIPDSKRVLYEPAAQP